MARRRRVPTAVSTSARRRANGGAPTNAAVLAVRVIPRAPRTTVDGERAGAILIRLAAPPVDGAANDALVAFLAAALGVPRRQVTIVSGATSRDKRVRIEGLDEGAVRARLLK
jgi:uncharacterized protein (TIGR00251 family)